MYETSSRQRTVSAIASGLIVAAGGLGLVFGLATNVPLARSLQDTLVALTPEPQQSPEPRPAPLPTPTRASKADTSRKKNAPSPANLRNQAAAVFAPVLPPIRTPPPVVAAPLPSAGDAANSGASNRRGPGQGAGGVGDGTGGGGNGDGDGTGADDALTRPIQTRGKLYWSDLPRELRSSHRGGELELVYRVNVDGRVSDCRVTHSSGLPALDAQTCRLITERFRFRPSRNARGEPVASFIVETHGWEPSPEDISDDDEG